MAKKSLADDILEAFERFAKAIESFASDFLEAVLRFLGDVAAWLERVVERIVEYLRRLFPILGQASVALFKLILIYLPGLVPCVVGVLKAATGWLVVGLVYIGFASLIGIGYRNR